MNKISPLFRRISPLILQLPGFNPGPLTLDGTNTYIIGRSDSRFLIDTVKNKRYLQNLKAIMESEQFAITKIAVTHPHQPHMAGLEDIISKHSFHSALTQCSQIFMNNNRAGIIRVSDYQRVQIQSQLFATFLHTPGHTADHIALWLEATGDLFTGDCVVGGESAQFEDLQAQLQSVDKLSRLTGLTRIHPGKGNCEHLNPYQKQYRLHREIQILDSIASQNGISSSELAQLFYSSRFQRDDPRYAAGQQNMGAHLKKLLKEGKIECVEGKYVKQ